MSRVTCHASRIACIGIGLAAVLCGLPLHALSISVVPPSRADGKLLLYSYPHNEVLEIGYRRPDGSADPQALRQIAHVMRSPDGGEAAIDLRLVELLDRIQDYFGAETVEIISGYRSPAYNRGLRANGHRVAKESLHMQGTAADIHLDETTEQAVREYAASLGYGGVGYYPSLHFVHVDLGRVRQWAEAEGPRKIVGREANTSPCQATTDRNAYLHRSSPPRGTTFTERSTTSVAVTIEGPSASCAAPEAFTLQLERFRRGTWQADRATHSAALKTISRSCRTTAGAIGICADYAFFMPSSPRPWGKYRLRIEGPSVTPILSNEFYLKAE